MNLRCYTLLVQFVKFVNLVNFSGFDSKGLYMYEKLSRLQNSRFCSQNQ